MGRPRPGLTRQQIAQTALQIIDESGPEAATVRNIAERLGVRSPSLYNHIRSKDEIFDAVTEIIDEQLDRTSLNHEDWRIALRDFARSYRQTFAAHPLALPVVARRAVETDAALSVYEAALARWQHAGWSPQDSLLIMAALEYLVLGSVLVPFTSGFVREPAAYSPDYPALSASLTHADRETLDDDAFELGLEILISTLDTRLAAGRHLTASLGSPAATGPTSPG